MRRPLHVGVATGNAPLHLTLEHVFGNRPDDASKVRRCCMCSAVGV